MSPYLLIKNGKYDCNERKRNYVMCGRIDIHLPKCVGILNLFLISLTFAIPGDGSIERSITLTQIAGDKV